MELSYQIFFHLINARVRKDIIYTAGVGDGL